MDILICEHCGKPNSIEENIAHKIRHSMEKEFKEKIKKQEMLIANKIKTLEKREVRLDDSEKKIKNTVESKLVEKSKAMKDQIQQEISSKFAEEIKLKDVEIEENKKLIAEGRKHRIELYKKEQQLMEKQEQIELESVRKLSELRNVLLTKARKNFAIEHEIKDKEKLLIISDLQKQIEVLNQRADQGSMQLQGEVQEIDIEDILKRTFPKDKVYPVKPGVMGADILQSILGPTLQSFGTILWEIKNTKSWNNNWLQKLKDDQINAQADTAVLVTKSMPRDMDNFGQIDGVWIISRNMVIPAAYLLRAGLIETIKAQNFTENMGERMEAIHRFLISPDFHQRMETIIQTFINMQNDLDTEKRSFSRIWNKRQKSIDRVIKNLSELWGDFQGLLGSEIGIIEGLELDSSERTLLLEKPEVEKSNKGSIIK